MASYDPFSLDGIIAQFSTEPPGSARASSSAVAAFLVFQAKGKEHLVGRDYDPLLKEHGRFVVIPEDARIQRRLQTLHERLLPAILERQPQAYRIYLKASTLLHSVEWGRHERQVRENLTVEEAARLFPRLPDWTFCTLRLESSDHYDLFAPGDNDDV